MKKILTALLLICSLASFSQTTAISSDLTYNFIHGYYFADSITYTPTCTRWNYSKINTAATTVGEADGITIAGDSITIIKAGDYLFMFSASITGGTGEDYHVKLFVNSVKAATPQGGLRFSTDGNSNYQSIGWWWYKKSLSVGDRITFHIANLTNNNDPTISSVKVYVEKKPE